MEHVTLDYSAQDTAEDRGLLSQLFDLSLLKFQQRDDVAATFRNYSRKVRRLGHEAIVAAKLLIVSRLGAWTLSNQRCFQMSSFLPYCFMTRCGACRSRMTCRKLGMLAAASSMDPDMTTDAMR